ncbi:MAG TPA: metalloregulator ArsR/SmtB family transcription factor [Patescibacteria group bacterium]|nr:metalloregulator ArsR/SmtB family transcription factor [Patescibacteria group bacterium]
MGLSPFTKKTYEKNAEIYKILANPKRLEILNILKNHELSVEELAKEVKIRMANLSQHLSVLRLVKLVKIRRDGQKIFYSIVDPRIVEPCKILHDLAKRHKI